MLNDFLTISAIKEFKKKLDIGTNHSQRYKKFRKKTF